VRSKDEFARLFEKAGWGFSRLVPLAMGHHIVEARSGA
jgi:hypothetical protein